MTATIPPAASDAQTARILHRADSTPGAGPDAFTAVLEATHAAAADGIDAVTPYVVRLWFTPWQLGDPAHVRDRESRWLASTTAATFDTGSARLAGFVAGDGPAVLLVHGWGDRAARLGAFLEPLTRRGLRVVGVDLPGHGGSGADPTDLYEWSDALKSLVRNEQVRGVIAHSLGGQAVLHALRHRADAASVDAVALLAPAVRFEHSLRTFASLFSLPPVAIDALRREIDRRYGADVWTELNSDQTARSVRSRGLIVHSRDDEQIDAADMTLLTAAWRGARLLQLDGAGHTRLLREPAAIYATTEFLAAALAP